MKYSQKTGDSDLIVNCLEKILRWVDLNGWSAYDKIDLEEINFWRKLKNNSSISAKFLRRGVYGFELFYPHTFRKLLGVKPQVTAGGVGHLASGYIALSAKLGRENYLSKAKEALAWLQENSISGYTGYAWGFPFDWSSLVLLPAGTPLSHTIVTCAMPFVDMFEFTQDSTYLDVAQSACQTVANDLNRTQYENGLITYAYTPLDNMEVLNTNLDVAWLFSRVGKYTKNTDFIEKGRRIGIWIVEEQQQNGSWYYFSKNFHRKNPSLSQFADSYHTGMVLRALLHLWLLESDDEKIRNYYMSAFQRGLCFYLEHFFGVSGQPYLYNENKKNFLDVYGAVQAILVLSEILNSSISIPSDLFVISQATLRKVVVWTIKNLQSPSGYLWCGKKYGFTYKLYSLRWGTALMISALANLLSIQERLPA